MFFSERSKRPIKVASALTLAIVSALWLGWERPYWAAFAVFVMAATETTGHSLQKGRHRILGTVLGMVAAFTLAGLFAQQQLPFLISYSLFTALCVYHQTNPKNGYVWTMTFMVASLILVMGKFSSDQTFNIAVLRLQETVLGVLSFTLVYSLLWPSSSRQVLTSTLQGYYATQATHLQAALEQLAETGTFSHSLSVGDSIKRLTRLEDLISAAQADSYHIASTKQLWQHYLAQMNQWALLCGHLSEASALLPTPLPESAQADIHDLLLRLEQRTRSAESLLSGGGAGVNPLPQQSTLSQQPQELSHHHGALRMLENVLTKIDRLHHEMLNTLEAIMLDKARSQPTTKAKPAGWRFMPENAINALKITVILWICIVLWLYVPMPGGALIVLLGGILGSVILTLPFISTSVLLRSIMMWSGIMLAQYVFLMPLMSEVWQLGAFYFLNAFLIWYVFHQPQQIIQRLLGSQILAIMTSSAMQLNPVYDINLALLQLMLIAISMLVIFLVNHTLFPATAEHVLLRELKRFRLGLLHRLTVMSRAADKPQPTWLAFSQAPLRSATMAEVASTRVNWPAFPDVAPENIRQLIEESYTLCVHFHAFQDSYQTWLAHSRNTGIERLLTHTLEELASLLDTPLLNESQHDLSSVHTHHAEASAINEHEQKLDAMSDKLQQYLAGFDKHSVLQLTLTPAQADQSYQLLTSLLLLAKSMRKISHYTHISQLNQLKLSPFSL